MIEELAGSVRSAVGEDRGVVALGGGADSAVLLAAAVKGLDTVRAVFVNHGLDVSRDLRMAAERLAADLGVPLTVLDAPVADGPNLEERLRDARYHAIETNLADDEVCCTGHTRDDQAETVLMRLLRGAGPTGLKGIPAARGRFRRPLLDVPRETIRSVAVASKLPFVDDPSNEDPRFVRSRIRTELIPYIESRFGPSFRPNIALSARLVGEQADVVSRQAIQIPLRTAPTEAALPTAPLLLAPRAVATAAIRDLLGVFHAPHGGTHTDIEAVYGTAMDGVQRPLSGDLTCVRENAEVVVVARDPNDTEPPVPLAVGTPFLWHGARYNVFLSESPALRETMGRRTALAQADRAGYVVRGVAEGDRIGLDAGTTPLTEVLRAAGVPARRRPQWPVVVTDGRVAAVAGVRVAPWARPVLGEPAIIMERAESP